MKPLLLLLLAAVYVLLAGTAAARPWGGAAQITILVANEYPFKVVTTSKAFAKEAQRLLRKGTSKVPVFMKVLNGTGCDPRYGFHVDPADMHWADATIELCDGTPRYVSDNLAEWMATVKQWCPWGAEVKKVRMLKKLPKCA